MAYQLSNNSVNVLTVGGVTLQPGGQAQADYLNSDIMKAFNSGLIGVTPAPATAEPTATALTSAAGTAAAGTVDVGAAFSQATLNNNFATIVAQMNKMLTALSALQDQVRTHEARMDKAAFVPNS